jgi:hypothetical protein
MKILCCDRKKTIVYYNNVTTLLMSYVHYVLSKYTLRFVIKTL